MSGYPVVVTQEPQVAIPELQELPEVTPLPRGHLVAILQQEVTVVAPLLTRLLLSGSELWTRTTADTLTQRNLARSVQSGVYFNKY